MFAVVVVLLNALSFASLALSLIARDSTPWLPCWRREHGYSARLACLFGFGADVPPLPAALVRRGDRLSIPAPTAMSLTGPGQGIPEVSRVTNLQAQNQWNAARAGRPSRIFVAPTPTGRRSPTSISMRSRADGRLPGCSRGTKRGALPPTSPSCQS